MFALLYKELEKKQLIAKKGVIVDATFAEVPRQMNSGQFCQKLKFQGNQHAQKSLLEILVSIIKVIVVSIEIEKQGHMCVSHLGRKGAIRNEYN